MNVNQTQKLKQNTQYEIPKTKKKLKTNTKIPKSQHFNIIFTVYISLRTTRT